MEVSTTDKHKRDSVMPSQDSILDVLTEACKPARKVSRCVDDTVISEAASCSSRHEEKDRISMLDHWMTCGLLSHPEEEYFSDEDLGTFEEDMDTDRNESYDSMTDEYYYNRRGRSRRGVRR